MKKIKIFLAASSQLREDREQFEIFIGRRNKKLVDRGVFLELVIWEDFLDVMGHQGLQEEYNRAVREADIFVMLYFTKVGKFTAEEFETAYGAFKEGGRPLIYTYFKDASISTGSADQDDLMSLWAFQNKLKELGHYQTVYKNVEDLQLKFKVQLDRLLDQWNKEEASESGENSKPTTETGRGIRGNPGDDTWSEWPRFRSITGWDVPDPKNSLGMDGKNSFQSGSFGMSPQSASNTPPGYGPTESAGQLPSHGSIMYSLPGKMQLNNWHRCVVRVAVDKDQLQADLPELASNPVIREQVRISSEMEVDMAPSEHFQFESISPVRQLVEREEATEWNINVRPLHLGTFPLAVRISVILPNGKKLKVLDESVQVVTAAVPEAMEFVVKDLSFEEKAPAPAIVRPVNGNPQQADRMRILFVSASPTDKARLQTGKEFRAIKAEIERGSQRDKLELMQSESDVTIGELVRAFSKKPDVVHFSGNGDEKGIYISTEDNQSQLLPLPALKHLFKQLKGVTQLVVLSACFSTTQAMEISSFGMYVVGFSKPIAEDTALGFARGLYIGMSEGKEFEQAYSDGLVILMTMEIAAMDAVEVYKDGARVHF